jgi:hypothetical protein
MAELWSPGLDAGPQAVVISGEDLVVSRKLRVIRAPFVVAPPPALRVRTRLHVSKQDEVVLEALGSHLGRWPPAIFRSGAGSDGSMPRHWRLRAGSASER